MATLFAQWLRMETSESNTILFFLSEATPSPAVNPLGFALRIDPEPSLLPASMATAQVQVTFT